MEKPQEINCTMTHTVTLSNGRSVRLIERDAELVIALVDYDGQDWYVCSMTADGVLVYTNSGDACQTITDCLANDPMQF